MSKHALGLGGKESSGTMSGNSKIQWTEKTWNPIAAFLNRDIKVMAGGKERVILKGTRGWFCVKVSPGCANCYAEGINIRLGNGLTYRITNLELIEFRLVNLEDPLKWKKPCMVFVNSMTDLFLEHIPNEMIDTVFAVMALSGRHTFQVLTKRHVRMRDYVTRLSKSIKPLEQCAREIGYTFKFELEGNEHSILPWPIRNIWLGVSVEDQQRADERIPVLLQTQAAIRFLSCEPLLGPINLDNDGQLPRVDWVIVGGESGRNARSCDLDWIKNIIEKCRAHECPVFVKQIGTAPFQDSGGIKIRATPIDRKGGDMAEWPESLRVREFPKAKVAA